MNHNPSLVSAESIKAKLKKEADLNQKDFNHLLLHYFIERLLYRLSISPYAANFILKGGLLLYTVLNVRGRATRDIDFLAENLKNTTAELARIFIFFPAVWATSSFTSETELLLPLLPHPENVKNSVHSTIQNITTVPFFPAKGNLFG